MIGTNVVDSLRLGREANLLDAIDTLRSQGISYYISLPQLIVYSNQSSSKSSVLEAISSIQFPTKDNIYTRFATKVILHRSRTTGVSMSIIPNKRRLETER